MKLEAKNRAQPVKNNHFNQPIIQNKTFSEKSLIQNESLIPVRKNRLKKVFRMPGVQKRL
jgi:hypothetical protein